MGEDKLWDEYANYVIKKTVYDCLKATFRCTPPEALTYLLNFAKEKVLPLLHKEGIPITEEELFDLLEDWFVKTGRFRTYPPPKNEHPNSTLEDRAVYSYVQ